MSQKTTSLSGFRFVRVFFASLSCLLLSFAASAQTTITTPLPTVAGSLAATNATITFCVRNNNTSAIILTDLGFYMTTTGAGNYTLWTNTTTLSGLPGNVAGPTWTSVGGTATAPPITALAIYPLFSGLTVNIPASTTVRFAIVFAGGSMNYGGGGNVPNISTAGGVDILTGDFQVNAANVGYSGNQTGPTFNPRFFIGSITFIPATPCAGKPDAGVINPFTACPNQNFTLSLNMPANQGGGLTYEWQKRTGNNPFVFHSNAMTATDNINVPTDYRCIVTCTNTPPPNNADTTPIYQATLSNFLYCYCNPVYTINGPIDNIVNVKLGVLNNNSASTVNNLPCWSNYTSQQPVPIPIPGITIGTSDFVDVTLGTDIDQYTAVWIDYNRNGIFETTEYNSLGTNAGANGVAHIPITVPANASAGLTRMRVRAGDDVQMNATQACGPTNSQYGEAEDYLVEIRYPDCAGPADPGIAYTTDTAMCPAYYFTLTDTNHTRNAYGLHWLWQESTTSGNIWNDVANTVDRDTVTLMFTNTAWYRLRIICSITGDTTYSNVVKINIKPPFKCYCFSKAIGGPVDTSDIGSFSMAGLVTTSGGPHLDNPDANKGRTDYTDLGPIVLYNDSTYQVDIFHTLSSHFHGDARVTMFIDYNNNLLYDIPEEAIYLTTTNPSSDWLSTSAGWYLSNKVRIPHAAIPNAPTGLRVIINNEIPYNVPSDMACGTYISGETEDYLVMFKRKELQSVANMKNLTDLSVYPNPNTGIFYVSFSTKAVVKQTVVTVTDITGRVLIQQEFDNIDGSFKHQFDLSSEARGVYFVEIKADGQKQTNKIITR